MFSKMTKILMLSASLLMGGTATATAADRNVVVPVVAGAAVGAVLATVIARNDRHDDRRYDRRPPPREYRHHYQPVRYVPVRPRYEHRRYAPAPRYHYRNDHRDHYDRRRG